MTTRCFHPTFQLLCVSWLFFHCWIETAAAQVDICEVNFDANVLRNPCGDAMNQQAPEAFTIHFESQYGTFVASCTRNLAPVWVDRVWNLAWNGYYGDNYFFRVIPNFVVQFGTAGDPSISNIYNWSSTTEPDCAILTPQPPDMQYCLASENCAGGLSNTFGTLSMSTSYNVSYPHGGVTWNATAELFINLHDNARLDSNLFIPICTIEGMDTVLKFPSFGEDADLGGTGPSLGKLYEEGNSYIQANEKWNQTMAKILRVEVCT